VTDDRRQRILDQLGGNGVSTAGRLCDLSANVTAMSGAGIMLRSSGTSLGSVGMTDAVSALIEELQFMLGEGPCIDAYKSERPIAEPDLAEPTRYWPGFTPPALEGGVRAIFAFPLLAGDVSMGALDLYRDHSGALSDDQYSDALIMADIIAQTVITMQVQATPGTLATELRRGTEGRAVVHQAAGMASAQLRVSVDEALLRLRAQAFANDRQVADFARDVVDRRVRFDPASGAAESTS